MVKESKGGTFAPTDYPVIKRALHSYLIECLRAEGVSERDPHPDVVVISNLLHRLGRIDG
jgi:hypothetical protein